MELLVSGISTVIERKDSRRIIIVGSTALLFLLLVTQSERIFENAWNAGALILITLGSLIGGINLSLAYTYICRPVETAEQDEPRETIRILRKIVSSGNVVWSITLLSILLGFLGFSAMFDLLPSQGQEIGYIGLFILLIATYTLARKVATP